MSKTNKIVGISFKLDEAKKIEAQAASMGLSTASYCRIIIRQHIASKKKLELKES